MTEQTKCANCEKTGLPILPVRYAVLPKTVGAKLPAGITGKGMTDVQLHEHQYGLRTLREGWLFVFHERAARGKNHWQAYRVTSDGRLWMQQLPLPFEPKTHPTCAKKSIVVEMDMITIEQPDKCGKVWLAFSEHAWQQETFDQYATNAALRAQRMQMIDPAQWVGSAKDPHGHAVEATQASIDDVVEYMPGFDPKLLNPPAGLQTQDTGAYNKALLERVATIYPLAIRQATPDSASAQLVKLMHTVGETGHGKSHPPMLLALWDGIGAAHELNGFRNDAGSMLSIYVRERAVQVDAMQCIDEAEVAVSNGAVARKSWWRRGMQAGWEGFLQNPYGGEGVMAPLPTAEEEAASQKRIEEAGEISPAEAKKIGEQAWPKYRDKLKDAGGTLKKFRQFFVQLQTDIAQIQAKRTPDVEAWLKAPVLLATLHDYSEKAIADGVAFNGVIAEAITGLPSEAKGAELVSKLVEQTDPTQPESIVWRGFAYNQKEPKAELKELLALATAYRVPLGEQVAEWSEKVAKALEKLKTFTELREKIGEAAEHQNAISATERALKAYHTDRLVGTIGNALFKWTGISKIGDCAGEYLIRGALMLRVGISKEDTVKIAKESVRAEPALRAKFEQGYYALRKTGVPAKDAFVRSMRDLASDERGKVMRAHWNAVKISHEGKEAAVGIRIAGVLAIIEVFCFAAALTKIDKSGQDYALLVASGFSATSACLTASTKAMTAMGKEAAMSLANFKAMTGYLGGAAALIGAIVDAGKIESNAEDGKMSLVAAYTVKTGLGLATAGANLLTALTSSAPLIERVCGGKVAWLGKAGAGIEGAVARAEALAAGNAVDDAVKVAMTRAAEEAGVEAATVIADRTALLMIGRIVLFMSGWEIAIAITVIQLLIAYFEDDDLQSWMEKCTFGKSANNPPWSAGKQHEGFEKALKSLGLQTEGQAE
ncbi:hypothetical protein C0Z18_14205 [Trinickia dabaoshanensis]|uniref:Toxin VasX N-terminal region domain-containing protein n=1 Tax=Trinickia dabaoshanensis TaxID=564714 RepID=A0A2N7VQN6_9BURK|nr:T6SS effector BTH_I2691 family protein [Trinickia dabaoshanensis]PMS19461.1 hypothetical protein C0Z18_14205 [Trinickia dabaoshanensis]